MTLTKLRDVYPSGRQEGDEVALLSEAKASAVVNSEALGLSEN